MKILIKGAVSSGFKLFANVRSYLIFLCTGSFSNNRGMFIDITVCLLGTFACLFVCCRSFFSKSTVRKILSEIQSNCQTVWIQIRPDVLSGLVCFQTVCKVYQQTTLVGKELTITAARDYYMCNSSHSTSSVNIIRYIYCRIKETLY